MSAVHSPVSDMLITVKSREVQRATLAEMRGDRAASRKHFLAAAHLELVLADDYDHAGDTDLAFRSRTSAASSFWRGRQIDQGRQLFESLAADHPARAAEIRDLLAELETAYPTIAP